MSSRQIQIVVGLIVVIAIGVGLVMLAERNRRIIAEKVDAVSIAGVETEQDAETAGAGEVRPEEGTAEAEAVPEAEPPQDTADSPQPLPPSFDVARFEPAGDGVLAGLTTPDAVVELLANDSPIATTTANSVGEWVIVLDPPLAPGNYDLALRSVSDNGEPMLSEEFIAVVIPEKPSDEVLVVASRPGQASEILSRPAASVKSASETAETAPTDGKPAGETSEHQVAAAEAAAAPAASKQDDAEDAEVALADSAAPEVGTEMTEIQTAARAMPASENESSLQSETMQSAAGADTEAETGTAESSPALPDSGSTEAGKPDEAAEQIASAETPGADQPAERPAESGVAAAPDITSGEIRTDHRVNMADGTASSGSTGEQSPEGAGNQGAGPGVAQSDTDTSDNGDKPPTDVASRSAETETVRGGGTGEQQPAVEIPATGDNTVSAAAPAIPANEPQAEGADMAALSGSEGAGQADEGQPPEVNTTAKQDRLSPAAKPADDEAASAGEVAVKPDFDETDEKPLPEELETAGTADEPEMKVAVVEPEDQKAASKPEEPKIDVDLALDAVETEGEMVYAAGTGSPGRRVRVYVDNNLIGETVANVEGRWLLESPAEIPAGDVVVRADELESDGADVARRAEVPFVKEVDAVALLPSSATAGGGASQSVEQANIAGPKSVIIRSGDNLWTISRRFYGRGVRYTTIYKANDDQIRNPHRIYPGQVFVIPEAEKHWVQ